MQAAQALPQSRDPDSPSGPRYNLVRRLLVPDSSAQLAIQQALAGLILTAPEMAEGRLVMPGKLFLPLFRASQLSVLRRQRDEKLYDVLDTVRLRLGSTPGIDALSANSNMQLVLHTFYGLPPKLQLEGASRDVKADRKRAADMLGIVTKVLVKNPPQEANIEVAAFPRDSSEELQASKNEFAKTATQQIPLPASQRYGPIEIMDMHSTDGRYLAPQAMLAWQPEP